MLELIDGGDKLGQQRPVFNAVVRRDGGLYLLQTALEVDIRTGDRTETGGGQQHRSVRISTAVVGIGNKHKVYLLGQQRRQIHAEQQHGFQLAAFNVGLQISVIFGDA